MTKTPFRSFPADHQDALARKAARKAAESKAYVPPNHRLNKERVIPANVPNSVGHQSQLPQPSQQGQQAQRDQMVKTQQPIFESTKPVVTNTSQEVSAKASLIPNPNVGFTNPTSNNSGLSVSLPSRFAYYDFKDIYISPLKIAHTAKISKAHNESSFLHLVEAVSSVLSTTYEENNLAFKLTLPDFYFVLYYLRLNCYTKFLYHHKTTCTNRDHIHKVEEGLLDASTLEISTLVTNQTLEVTELESMPDPAMYVLSNGMTLKPPTIQDVLEITGNPMARDAEFQAVANIAAAIDVGYPISLVDRIDIAKDLTPDDEATVQEYLDLMESYGVVEKIKVHCKECGAARVTKVHIAAHSFLPTA